MVGAVALLFLGCTPKIGDDCTVSTNCSAAGDRLCDTTQPGGYCTIFNCEPGTCPEDSVCINFGASVSELGSCSRGQATSPYERSFCMASCSSSADCRGGYVCLDLSGRRDSNGQLLEPSVASLDAVLAESSGSGKVCIVKPAPVAACEAGSAAGAEAAPSAGGAGSMAEVGASGDSSL